MKHYFLKSSLVMLATVAISGAVIADPAVCAPNDYCVNVKLTNIGQPNLQVADHAEGTTMGKPFSFDHTLNRSDNSWTQFLRFNGDTTKYPTSQFKFLIKNINGKDVKVPCQITHALINHGETDNIEIININNQYVCKVSG